MGNAALASSVELQKMLTIAVVEQSRKVRAVPLLAANLWQDRSGKELKVLTPNKTNTNPDYLDYPILPTALPCPATLRFAFLGLRSQVQANRHAVK
jgi:hypothetical protein